MNDEQDFSLKWFGIPDAKVVAFWKRLRPVSKETHEAWCKWQRELAARRSISPLLPGAHGGNS